MFGADVFLKNRRTGGSSALYGVRQSPLREGVSDHEPRGLDTNPGAKHRGGRCIKKAALKMLFHVASAIAVLLGAACVDAAALPGLGPRSCPPRKFWSTTANTYCDALATIDNYLWVIAAASLDPFYEKRDREVCKYIDYSDSRLTVTSLISPKGFREFTFAISYYNVDRSLNRASVVVFPLGLGLTDTTPTGSMTSGVNVTTSASARTQEYQLPFEEHFIVAFGTSKNDSPWAVITVGTPSQVSNGCCLSPNSGSLDPITERLYILLSDPSDEDGYNDAIKAAKSFDLDVSSLTRLDLNVCRGRPALTASKKPAENRSKSVGGGCKKVLDTSPSAYAKSKIAAAKAKVAAAAAAKAASKAFGFAPNAAPAAVPMGAFAPSPYA
ncbi:hypothetical protein HDU96_003830 [Phlyctochytrium bullatum]|nr:hypothetical protein HDU96_003830 [Phlyctochytrium bullatum]